MAKGRRLPPKDALSLQYILETWNGFFAMHLSLLFSYMLALIEDSPPSSSLRERLPTVFYNNIIAEYYKLCKLTVLALSIVVAGDVL